MAEQNDLMTCKEVAAMKKVNLRSVYRAIKEERLPNQKIGDVYVIPRSAAERWRARSGRYKEASNE